MAAELIEIGGKEYTLDEMRVLAKYGAFDNMGAKNDTSSTTATAQPMHGVYPNNSNQFGPLSGAGARPGMFNTTVRTRTIGRVIPLKKSIYRTEIIDVMTGVLGGSGNNSTSACIIGPQSGALKTCRQTYQFGAIHLATQVVDITKVGKYLNRADVDREMWNLASVDNKFLPQFPGIEGDMTMFGSQFRANMYAFGVNLERAITPVHFAGVQGTQDNTYRGVPTQWDGLDQQYKINRTDPTGVICDALDSDVVNFNQNMTSTDAFGRSFVEAVTDTYFGRKQRAASLSMEGVVFAIVMRPDQFRAATEVWACTYGVYRCTSSNAGQPIPRTPAEIAILRDDMYQGTYLLIDGDRVPVILDDSMNRDTLANNTYKAKMYIVPLSWAGRDLLYADYFDQANPQAMEFANAPGFAQANQTTLNDGMYRVFRYETGGCLQYDFWSELRLIQDAPFLAASIDNVWYNSYYKQSDPRPGQSYYANGGVSYRTNQLP